VRTEARFPALDKGAGHYESFYIKAADPAGGRALWLRHTVHKRPGKEPTASIWMTLFDASAGKPRATKATYGAEQLSVPAGAYVRVGEAEIGPGTATGSLETDAFAASWDLRFTDHHEALRHLPNARMYEAKLPRTKLLSPHPGATFAGSVTIDGERIELTGWPGMVGHNWGAEHAERWIWIHGAGFEGRDASDYLDIGAGKIKIGPWRTPWIANGAVALDGEVHKLGGLGSIYGTDITETPTSCEFVVPGKGVTVRGRVGGDAERFVGWIYADPDGGEHNTVNSSIADIELRVERVGKPHVHLEGAARAAYELGMKETDHGIPIQPYPDG
jgi:hypothetical protein